MISRLCDSLLLQPSDIEPSHSGWEVIGVFNPSVAMVGDELVMLARVAERPAERRAAWTPLTRWDLTGSTEFDWVRDEDLIHTDARVFAMKNNGDLRLTSISHFQLFRAIKRNPDTWKFAGSLLPEGSWEEFGIEDPRITKIDETYWISYVAVSRSGAATALMSSTDLVSFQRHGIIFPSENKDVVLFPSCIAGDFVALHRPNPHSHFSPPQIWLARSPDLIHWGRHEFVLGGVHVWEGDRVGSGTAPILCDEGWLTLYHGSTPSNIAGKVGRYCVGALLLDHDQPGRVLGRSREPIMQSATDFETSGFVPNVVFPCGAIVHENHLVIPYAMSDYATTIDTIEVKELLASMS